MRRTRAQRLAGGAFLASTLLRQGAGAFRTAAPAPSRGFPPGPGAAPGPRLGGDSSSSSSSSAAGRRTLRPLRMAAHSDGLRDPSSPSAPVTSPPLSRDEEAALLAEAAEYRRLRTLERDAAMRSPDLSPPRPSALAREAGYDDDVDEYEDAYDGGLRAREALVTRNMGLVHYVVNDVLGAKSSSGKRRLNSLSRDDLLQEGFIGLSRAVDRYDPSRSNGARFSTYAVYWIRAAVLRCIAEKDDVVRVPVGVTEAIGKVTRAAGALGIELDGDGIAGAIERAHDAVGVELVSEGEARRDGRWREAEAARALAEEAGLTDGMLREAMRVRRRRNAGGYTSLEPWMQTKAVGRSGGDLGASAAAGGSLPGVFGGGEDAEELRRTLGEFLQPRELEALSWRYGLARQEEGFKDYEAEAMEGLFGEGGILAPSIAPALKSAGIIAADAADGPQVKSKVLSSSKTKPAATAAATTAKGLPQRGKWGEAMSFAEVGKRMAVSAEYGRRLCRRALDKLRKAAEEGRLELQPEWLV